MDGSRRQETARDLLDDLMGGRLSSDDRRVENISSHTLGALGEELATWYLRERGYAIIERNYRCPEGEADIVAFDEESSEIVLVEVKTRRHRRDCTGTYPEQAVTPRKRQRYRRIAHHYVVEHYPAPAVRFDVIAVDIELGAPDRTGSIRHLYRAFDWEAM